MIDMEFLDWWKNLDSDALFANVAYRVAIGSSPGRLSEDAFDDLLSDLSLLYSVEGQAVEAIELEEIARPSGWSGIAPVSLAKNWSPFARAKTLLGTPTCGAVNPARDRAVAIWEPPFFNCDYDLSSNEHDRHLEFLLLNACAKARSLSIQVAVVFTEGFSYESYVTGEEGPIGMEAAMAMHRAGYLYTERVAR